MPYIVGERDWSGEIDDKGYRTYKLVTHVITDNPRQGPAAVMQTPGLPLPGSYWQVLDDVDVWVWCRPGMRVKSHGKKEGHPGVHWTVEQTFSNKPLENDEDKCQDQQIDDPLLQPPRLSGDFNRLQELSTTDMNGITIRSSSHEVYTNDVAKWDVSRIVIRIEQNVPLLQLSLLDSFNDSVNDRPFWGFPARWIKLTIEPWEKVYYGSCYTYYKRGLVFELKRGGWDRVIRDEGTKVLNGHWDDATGEGCQVSITVGQGSGATVNIDEVDEYGRLLAVSVGNGGSNYPKNKVIPLMLHSQPVPLDDWPSVAVVLGTVDDTGKIISVKRVFQEPSILDGYDYYVTENYPTSTNAPNGMIVSVDPTPVSPGFNYPADSTITLGVVSGKGTYGSITAKTNYAGEVVEILGVANPGRDYETTDANTEVFDSGWVLDPIDGKPPDPNNPTHFIQFKDRNGENTNVILNGAGCPASSPEKAATITWRKYPGRNFLLLGGIPLTI